MQIQNLRGAAEFCSPRVDKCVNEASELICMKQQSSYQNKNYFVFLGPIFIEVNFGRRAHDTHIHIGYCSVEEIRPFQYHRTV